jgi:predicted DNA-binding protein YlxM (UPF0122 family)
MAYSDNQWNKAKGYYEAGLSLAKIKEKTGIARNTISQRAKKEHWEHGKNIDYIEAKEVIAVKKGTEKEQSIICADEVADDLIRRKNLVMNASEKIISKATMMLDEVDSPQDLKHISYTVDKTSITLGVNQRHANSQVNINNTNAMQTNINTNDMTDKEISQTYLDMIKRK